MLHKRNDPAGKGGVGVLLSGEQRNDNCDAGNGQYIVRSVEGLGLVVANLADRGCEPPAIWIGFNPTEPATRVWMTDRPRGWPVIDRTFYCADRKAAAAWALAQRNRLVEAAERRRADATNRRKAMWSQRLSFMSRGDEQ